jgi:ribosome-associated protein
VEPRRCLIATTSTTTTSPGEAAARGNASDEQTRQFAIECARLAANTRCHNVVCLDVRGISPVTDYMVLATGTSPRQMRTVCDDLAEMAEQRGERPLGTDGVDGPADRGGQGGGGGGDTAGGGWMVIDFVTVVVHVFSQDARAFYDLDSLWGDAKKVEWNNTPTPPATTTGA